MLHIILLILKIIGIAILVIIGLLLFILLTVLLVPIRYRAAVTHGEEVKAKGSVSWLFHILGAKVSYLEGKLHIRVRVLWITLYDNLQPKKKRIKKEKKKTAARKTAKKKSVTDKRYILTSKTEETTVPLEKSRPPVLTKSTESKEETEQGKDHSIQVDLNQKESHLQNELKQKEIEQKELQQGEIQQKELQQEELKQKEEITDNVEQSESQQEDWTRDEEKIGKLKKIINRIKGWKERIAVFIKGIKSKIKGWINIFSNIKHKIKLIYDFIKDEYNKEGFQITYSSLKKLLKHILPTKLKSRLVFGTGDPCSTGQALGAMSILYSFYGDNIVIIPDFETKRLEGKHFAKGRIRLVTVLIIVIKLIFNKGFIRLKNNFQILKEAL